MAGGIRIHVDPRAAEKLSRASQMAAALGAVADDAAAEVERRAPRIVRGRGSRIYGEVQQTADGAEGIVAVKSPFWHFPEYGHSRYPPDPYLRPGVQATLSKVNGRFSSE